MAEITKENFRFAAKESVLLAAYCDQESRSKTEVVRELVRTLEGKLDPETKQLLKAQVKKES